MEVGTGFHPELTGRENVYMNGTILGMTKREIDRKFDEIVDFSGVERFLDTPIKRYSSGMQVRLAFAVAAHLEPEILIVDEVLAVGDAEFQAKCLRKMQDVAHFGRTVLFVSHNMTAIQRLCSCAVHFSNGVIQRDGQTSETVASYLSRFADVSAQPLSLRTDRGGSGGRGDSRIHDIRLYDASGDKTTTLYVGQPATLKFCFATRINRPSLVFAIYDTAGTLVADFTTYVPSCHDSPRPPYSDSLVCVIDRLLLTPGRYRINAFLSNHNGALDYVEGAFLFDVQDAVVDGRPVTSARAASASCRISGFSQPTLHNILRR